MKRISSFIVFIIITVSISGESLSGLAYKKRVELMDYLRDLEIMTQNFRGKDKNGNPASYKAEKGLEGERVLKYDTAKTLYQEGLLYYYEKNFNRSYTRFLEAQLEIEKLLEELSIFYIEETEKILKSSIEKKNANNPEDKNLIDIAVEYSRESYLRLDLKEPREAPTTRRMYNPREYHYVTNRYAIERSMEYGYTFLGEAKDARQKALNIERYLERHQKLEPSHRKYRIELYLGSIARCRDAVSNAVNIFKLKYPYDNYYLQMPGGVNEKSENVYLEGATMDFSQNPYIKPYNLNPVFDLRIPAEYRRAASDSFGRIYDDEVNTKVKLQWDSERRKELSYKENEENKSGNNATTTTNTTN